MPFNMYKKVSSLKKNVFYRSFKLERMYRCFGKTEKNNNK